MEGGEVEALKRLKCPHTHGHLLNFTGSGGAVKKLKKAAKSPCVARGTPRGTAWTSRYETVSSSTYVTEEGFSFFKMFSPGPVQTKGLVNPNDFLGPYPIFS